MRCVSLKKTVGDSLWISEACPVCCLFRRSIVGWNFKLGDKGLGGRSKKKPKFGIAAFEFFRLTDPFHNFSNIRI